MAASWSGAVEFGGFPVHVSFHSRTKSRSGKSFRSICPDGAPARQQLIDGSGEVVDRSTLKKGVEVTKGQFVTLTDEQVEAIGRADRSAMVEPEQLVPVASLPMELATGSYVVVPNEKVPGSAASVNQFWNGLLAGKLAYVTRVVMRAGSGDSLVALYAEKDALVAVALPFVEDLAATPEFEFTVDKKAAAMFKVFAEKAYGEITGEFEHRRYESEHGKRRDAAIQAALEGTEIEVPEAPEPAAATTDLMAALEAAVEEAGAKKAKPKAARKPKAKVTA